MHWTDNGELIYRQTKIPETNIVDLVSDVLDTKAPASGKPKGWEPFAAGLKAAVAPQDLVKNPTTWNFMQGTSKKKELQQLRRSWIPY